ncbi:MAG: hypothetical protein Q8873_08665 [Bacillota bacterium]|nr:hypothetical protein [Bacillota bacterium]
MYKNDWRLTNQMNYLQKKTLLNMRFEPFKKGWEHEHCEFCSKRIDSKTIDAYTTEDRYYWICKECFDDFKEMFEWKVKNN